VRERPRLAKYLHAWYPIRAFAVNQMADDMECTPCAFTFIAERLRFRQIAQERVEGSGSASEKRYGVLQSLLHISFRCDSRFRAALGHDFACDRLKIARFDVLQFVRQRGNPLVTLIEFFRRGRVPDFDQRRA
jgi:hypothetical protein